MPKVNIEREVLTKKSYIPLVELKNNPRDYITLHVKPPPFPHHVDELLLEPEYNIYADEIKRVVNIKTVVQETEKYNTGAAIFWQENGNKHIALPPFPIIENKVSRGELAPSLHIEAKEREYVVGIILVAWSSYSIGILQGDDLAESKTGTEYIHKKHRKRGRSERRFARWAEKQERDFLKKVSSRIEERFKNYTIDPIFFERNRLGHKPLLQKCTYLNLKTYKTPKRILNIKYTST
ncbi:MAG: hypothetical protein JW732_04975 [Dehalococcoidia bacterium]|nr:hypothetical protein [Dehalococcoidia bacterium]